MFFGNQPADASNFEPACRGGYTITRFEEGNRLMKLLSTIGVLATAVVLSGIFTSGNAVAGERKTILYVQVGYNAYDAYNVVLKVQKDNGPWKKYTYQKWPGRVQWENVAPGTYTLKAHGFDKKGKKLVAYFGNWNSTEATVVVNPDDHDGVGFQWIYP
jgi:hypothetical protein